MAGRTEKGRPWLFRGIWTVVLLVALLSFGSAAEAATWWQATSNTTSDLMSVAYGGGLWVAVGKSASNTDHVLYSSDAQNWTETHPTGGLNNWYGVASAGSSWVIVGNAGHVAYTADPTGASDSWHSLSPASGNLWSVASDGTKVIAVGAGGTVITASTTNLSSWSVMTGVPSTVTLYDIVHHGGTWVAVGRDSSAPNGRVYKLDTSSNTWVSVATNASTLAVAAYGNNEFLVAGDDGAIMTSSNGTNWSSTNHGTGLYQGAAYGLGKWVLTTFEGTIETFDGTTWATESGPQAAPPAATHYLRALRTATEFVVVGYAGLIGVQLDDTTPPTTTDNAPAGWTNQNTTVALTATDNISGVSATYYQLDGGSQTAGTSVSITTEGDHTLQYWSVDNAGNVESAHTVHVKVDKTAPTLTGAVTTAPNASGWYNGNVTVHWTASDALSGISAATPDTVVTAEGSNLSTGTVSVSDNAGNSTSATVSGINIDRTAPATTASGAPAGWTQGDVTVTLSASDTLSGVAATYYALDGGTTQQGTSVTVSTAGDHSLVFWSVDQAGNTASQQTVQVKIDRNAPSIGHRLAPAANGSGWNNADVIVTFTCTDAESGVASCTTPVTISTEGQGQTVSGTATDNAGNSAADSVTVSLDKTAPTISVAADRAPDSGSWYTADVAVTFTCTDALSGIATCTSPVEVGEGANQSASGTATDIAGNSASASVTGINVDKTPPTVASNAPAGPVNTDQSITLTASDTLSGVGAVYSKLDSGSTQTGNTVAVTGEGTHTLEFWAMDVAGNASVHTTQSIMIDKTRPTITHGLSPTPNGRGWNRAAVTVTFTCADAGSGVSSCPPAQTVSTEGANRQATGTATDAAGNSATDTATVNLDLTPPTLSGAATTAPNANGWYKGNVTIHWTASDSLSGINPATLPPDTVITGSGSNLSATATVSDYAGNSTTFTVSGINIKRTPPVLTLSQPSDYFLTNSNRLTFGGAADLDATVRLHLDGALVATITPGTNGLWSFTPATALSAGVHSWYATATDLAGNVTTSAIRRFTLDNVAPYVTLSNPGSVVLTATPTLSGTAEPGSQVTVMVDGASIGSVTSTGAFSVKPASPLSEGPHTAYAWAVDGAGNGAASGTVQFVVNAKLPSVAITSPTAGQAFSKRPDISGTADPDATVTVSIGGKVLGSVKVGANRTWTVSGAAAQLQAGPNQVVAEVKDTFGRAGAPATVTFTYSPKGGLVGTVTKDDGQPAAGVAVQVTDAGGAVVATVTTDQAGGFKLNSVPAASLKVTAGSGSVSASAQVTVEPDKTATVTLQLPPPGVRHAAYVTGYPDGTFRPDQAVTRAEAAAMLARLLADGSVRPAAHFADVAGEHWASGAIGFVQAKGLMIGDPDGRFRPNDTITRAELAVIVSRMKGLSPVMITRTFTDTAGHWAAGYIEAARQAGLVTGFPDGSFHPQEVATRAQFVAMMARTLGRGQYLGRTVPTFSDVPASHWAAGYVEEAVTDHLMTRLTNGVETW